MHISYHLLIKQTTRSTLNTINWLEEGFAPNLNDCEGALSHTFVSEGSEE